MHINRLVERFMREQNMSPTRFGRLAARDPRLVFDMRMGREIRSEMEQSLRKFMLQHHSGHSADERNAA